MFHARQELEPQRAKLEARSRALEAARQTAESLRAELEAVPQTKAAAGTAIGGAPIGFSLEEIRDAGRA